MQRWKPDPGERVVARAPVSFATGAATRVAGKRWFRDPDRRDVQSRLEGWPERPPDRIRSKAHAGARIAGGVVLAVLVVAVAAALGGTGVGNVDTLGSSDDPENEVEDFPVMWAAPGTLARTLPWELDPARRPDTDRTHAVVTDRRLLVIGSLDDPRDPWEEVLWETDLGHLASVERKAFSRGERDFQIVFVDGSWCRLTSADGDELIDQLSALSAESTPGEMNSQ
jgi:hypothetical protein